MEKQKPMIWCCGFLVLAVLFQLSSLVAQEVSPGKVILKIENQLTVDLPKDKHFTNCFHQVFPCKMRAGRTYLIDLKSNDFDAFLRLEDPQGKKLAENDDGVDNLDSRLVFRPGKDDTFRIIATTIDDGQTGKFTLTVRETIEKEVLTVKSQLTNDLPKDKVQQGSFHRIHEVKMVKDRVYVVELTSKDFDSYLRLEDPQGQELADDDDGGGGLNSRIVFQAPDSAVFRVIATTLEDGATGRYQLRIHEVQEAKD